jgi:hypothetical protein
VGSDAIVGVDPRWQRGQPVLVRAIERCVGPLLEQGAVEALNLAVDLWPARRDRQVSDPELLKGRVDRARARVAPCVVGHHPFDRGALFGERDGRHGLGKQPPFPPAHPNAPRRRPRGCGHRSRRAGSRSRVVARDLRCCVNLARASASLRRAGSGRASSRPRGGARLGGLARSDGWVGRWAVEVIQPCEAVPPKHAVDRGARSRERRSRCGAAPASADDARPRSGRSPPLTGRVGGRAARSFGRSGPRCFVEEASDPLVDGGTRHRRRLGDPSRGPSVHQDPFDHHETAERGEPSLDGPVRASFRSGAVNPEP